jgi:hypothetical protein
MTPVAATPAPSKLKERACKHCSCTYFTPCDMGNGEGCAWVTKDECSACVSPHTGKKYKHVQPGVRLNKK